MKISDSIEKARSVGANVHIGVEGINFMHLLREKISEAPELQKICLHDFDNKINREKWLQVMKAQLDRGSIQALGIICDIDLEARQSRVQATSDLFRRVFDREVNERELALGDPILSFLVVPTTVQTGCLEHALLENASISNCVNEFTECLRHSNQGKNDNFWAKTKVRSMMIEKGMEGALSTTATTDMWDWTQGSLADMLNFLRVMNDSVQ